MRAIADEGEAALSWQVVPALVSEALGDPGAERGQRAVRAVSAREDLDLAALRAAADGASS